MIRLFIVLGLLAVLLSLAAWEQVYIDKTYGKMIDETSALVLAVNSTPEGPEKKTPFAPELKNRVDSLYSYWQKKERKMCIVTRHMELSYISDALIYARNFIHNDNKEEATAGLDRLKYLVEAYRQVYGINFLNIL